MKNSEESADRIHLQEEMMLRGFAAVLEEKGASREYAEAYDAFLVENGLDEFLGNKPENVQEAFKEQLERDFDGR